jgi:hypothetical protein
MEDVFERVQKKNQREGTGCSATLREVTSTVLWKCRRSGGIPIDISNETATNLKLSQHYLQICELSDTPNVAKYPQQE